MICFTNPGEIDPRLIQLMGANVKPNTKSPIGYFGTGLKYAIAVMLRHNCKLQIFSGTTEINFSVKPTVLRDKEFQVVWMHTRAGDVALPFTLELGKNWQLWMAYRELYCNAIDEGGDVIERGAERAPGRTVISTVGLESIHKNRHEFILASMPLAEQDEVDIHPGEDGTLFYKGIKVGTLENAVYRYNVKSKLDLTEDRTYAGEYSVKMLITRALFQCENRELIANVLLAPKNSFEHLLDFNTYSLESSTQAFKETLAACYKTHKMNLGPYARLAVKRIRPDLLVPPSVTLTRVQESMLRRSREMLASLGYTIEAPVHVVADLGANVYGSVIANGIYISLRAFEVGTKCVCGTLLEEHLHITKGYDDCSRDFQNFLIDKVISLGEELRGEVL